MAIEQKWQQYWGEHKMFESDVPSDWKLGDERNKFLVTFPYPYMNGRLHLGHLFTITKSEFAAGYQRLKGKNVLFPFGFHVTGQPICGAAKKLEAEFVKFGNPPVVPQDPIADEQAAVALDQSAKELGVFSSNKSKAKAKAGKYQFQILLDFGVKPEDLQKFTNPLTWVDFFPPLCQEDLVSFGARVDWRRSFYTTDANPVYDSFIRWQFNQLKANGYIKFGKRNTIWSPLDGQPCMDHDRASGEGVQPQEYVIVLTELLKSHPCNQHIYRHVKQDDMIYLACATLRPETMCGQTNVWIQPDENYLLIRIEANKIILTGQHAALNMAFQGMNNGKPMGEIDEICQIQGREFINCMVKAPLTPLPEIPVLPLLTILMTKGTGVVTSVPSDAPDDYMALKDIRNNFNGIVEKYSINVSQIPIDIIKIINIPKLGDCAAMTLCEEKKIKNQFDKDQLKEVKDLCYLKGFYDGIMIAGPFINQRVQDCKILSRQFIMDNKQGFVYAEPQSEIIARSGCECVVAHADQWYLNYGDEDWKALVQRNLQLLDTYNDEVKNQFIRVLDWLKQWAVSRSFGLGTRMPWDEKVLIESLSDSTIYNAYYTISHILQNGTLNAKNCPIPIEYIDDNFFNYVFDKSEHISAKHEQFAETLKYLKRSFLYWYPVDLRCSGKDLVQNHLTMMLYNHCAIWSDDESKWPRGMRSNGHLLLDDSKMSKGSGNFLEAKESISIYSADAVRFALADAGDGIDDANFKRETAEGAILKLVQMMKSNQSLMDVSVERSGDMTCDKIFQSQYIDASSRADKSFSRCLFREGIIIVSNEMNRIRELYIRTADQQGQKPCRCLCYEFVKLQCLLLGVTCPHTAEEINQVLLQSKESIFRQVIPFDLETRANQLRIHSIIYEQVNAMISRLKTRYNDVIKPKKDGTIPPKPNRGIVYVATQYLDWQEKLLDFLSEKFSSNQCGKDIVGIARQYAIDVIGIDPKDVKLAIKFISNAINISKTEGAEAFVTRMPFDEKVIYQEYIFLIKQNMNLENVEIYIVGEGPFQADKCSAALPGRPIIFFD